MRILITLLCLTLMSACAKEAVNYAQLSRQGPVGVSIDGYSPVSYFTDGKSQKGSSAFEVSHNGNTYWLTSAEQVELFNNNPEYYQPAHGGWCSLMLTGSGQLTPANPESFKIVNDRLLLFWSGDFNGQPIDGGRNWESKFKDSTGEMALLAKADNAWARLLSGQAKQKIVLFNPHDAERVNEQRRLDAKKQCE